MEPFHLFSAVIANSRLQKAQPPRSVPRESGGNAPESPRESQVVYSILFHKPWTTMGMISLET
jgi:hypothetical protein